ncbi:exopolyphosphatase [Neptunomonas antarctica]|uniref:Exopolyphosphatase n=1 Tax=Neptunomonas antarctica TaxID=619304 RepID=A0A1N7MKE6_9GAMM|nr:exopolyphosphatase [Neptunomonas antarctica]SIS86567.1 exopolyphosphatase / guanosine-5'-triphosphate,3'-diphosphate pyrophosphatase [Neptunomonas antarctica]
MLNPEYPADPTREDSLLAAIDLGSNSFHMVVARLSQGELSTVDMMSEKVQLAAGIGPDKRLSSEAMERGLTCLSRFAQPLNDYPPDAVKIVATNALREAVNRRVFTERAEKILGVPIEIIAGREEARLIYLGVSHTLANTQGARLVIDIGGGSTECIIGEHFEPIELESLHMGCVSYTQLFFVDGIISEKNFRQAEYAAMRELLSIRETYKKLGWTSSVGSSGTIKAIKNACIASGFSEENITRDALHQLKEKVLSFNNLSEVDIAGVKQERAAILPAGLAILTALFNSLNITEMTFSEGALREGLLYDMAGRLRHEDVRERSISALIQRYHVNEAHAQRIEQTALSALDQVKHTWGLKHPDYHEMLSWAARTHEIGLTIAHNQFHKHSAYLLQHSDLAGFTNPEQLLLAFLARGNRRKFPKEEYKQLPESSKEAYKRLCVLLRLSVIFHRSRSSTDLPAFTLKAEGKKLELCFEEGVLTNYPLTQADLEQEIEYLKNADIKLSIN